GHGGVVVAARGEGVGQEGGDHGGGGYAAGQDLGEAMVGDLFGEAVRTQAQDVTRAEGHVEDVGLGVGGVADVGVQPVPGRAGRGRVRRVPAVDRTQPGFRVVDGQQFEQPVPEPVGAGVAELD